MTLGLSGRPRREDLGIGLVSFAQLGLELMFVKMAHYEFGTFSLAVVGVALLGVALAGPATGWLGGAPRATARALLALPVVTWLAGALLFSLEHERAARAGLVVRALLLGSACLSSLALASVPVFAAMQRSPDAVRRIYAASLLGAALGVLGTLGMLHLAGDSGAYAGLLGSSSAAAFFLVEKARERRIAVVTAGAFAVLGVFAFPRLDAAAHPRALYVATDAISRIEVRRSLDGSLRFRTAGVNTGTSTAPPFGSRERSELRVHPTTLPFHSVPGRVLLIGSGAGRNVTEALDLGVRRVVAVEINRMIPEYMRHALPVEDDPYRDPRVTLLVGEGREIAANLARHVDAASRFDLVYVPVATLFGSTGQPVVETYLMTREAFSLYLDLLARDGTLGVFVGVGAARQMVSAFAGALALHGVDPGPHLTLVRYGPQVALLARPDRIYTDDERHALARTCSGGELVDVSEDLARPSPPVTDDAPYWLASAEDPRDRLVLLSQNLAVTRGILLAAFASLGVVFVLSLFAAPRAAARGVGFVAGFAAMGAAYAVLQTVYMQRLGFLLGHPLLGAAAVLPATLAGTALGAFLSERVPARRWTLFRSLSTSMLMMLIVAADLIEPRSLLRPEWSPWTRVVAGSLLSLLPFIVAGSYFPTAFARVERETPSATNVSWLANGLGAATGSIFCVYGGMRAGFAVTLLLPAVLYCALSVWDVLVRRARVERAANLGIAATLAFALVLCVWLVERAPAVLQ